MQCLNMHDVPNSAFWTNLQHIAIVLESFKASTNMIQKDTVTLAAVSKAEKKIKKTL